ncbi:hypothetical protein BKA67DRAFT_259790 [Truncatella angustata]|uniref:Uncharacterized protein n=1 Tax=Truncatella angustata TaxID=152316 RepID=A0A9P8UKC1_9PEZI|nr:uncharacterized protein BKA67DRAFT_259790 [Truncatella angustata]KAH6653756.1 hypothetical protein BKA67DRAFT_259790 [Truncatella angustata]KAH8199107.1 hypothetical protein TruAng_006743 [Truncatella angustata]
MFGGLANLLQPSVIGPPPNDVPPATPVEFPEYTPQSQGGDSRQRPLIHFLQSLHRPADLSEAHFAALGVEVYSDVPPEDIVPDSSFLPSSSSKWDSITLDQVGAKDATFRIPLSNGNMSPEARVYLERRNELSIDNQTAFRTVRRLRPEPGMKTARLGNSYEFYRHLEQMAGYWDDTSLPPVESAESDVKKRDHQKDPLPNPLDGSLKQVRLAVTETATSAKPESQPDMKETQDKSTWRVTYRTASGSTMPAEIRHNMVSFFVKLVSYDFGCNISGPRVEPRVQLIEPSDSCSTRDPVTSYFPSGCVFVVRIPTTREAARSGITEGPLGAVSARNVTTFATLAEKRIDFGRELVAALVTAQHRAREGKEEQRFGEGKWWATAKRWGGGEGGPIGREIESSSGGGVVGDKDRKPSESSTSTEKPSLHGSPTSSSSPATQRPQSPPKPISPSSGLPMHRAAAPASSKRRKGGSHQSMYDKYRQVSLPSSNWDKKARYLAIGKVPGASHDDVFVISSMFHHVSVLRVRVPQRLLDVLAGAADDENKSGERSWGKLEVWRSKWFDLFLVEDRLEALRVLWGVNAWSMRKVEG